MLEGTQTDRPALDPAAGIGQWTLQRQGDDWTVDAGSLQELTPGSVLLALDDRQNVIGALDVREVGLDRSIVVAEASEDYPAADSMRLKDGMPVRLQRRNVVRQLRVGRSPPGTSLLGQTRVFDEALLQLDDDDSLQIEWTGLDEPADVYLRADRDRIWLLPPSGELRKQGPSRTPSILLSDTPEMVAFTLKDALGKIARANALLNLARQTPSADELAEASVLFKRSGDSDYRPLTAAARPELQSGDRIRIELRNDADTSVDVNVLFIDADWGITAVLPATDTRDNRLDKGSARQIDAVIDGKTSGFERLMIITQPARAASRTDLRYFQQTGVSMTAGIVRGTRISIGKKPTLEKNAQTRVGLYTWIATAD